MWASTKGGREATRLIGVWVGGTVGGGWVDEWVGEWECEMDGKVVASSACMIRRRPRWISAERTSVQVLTGPTRCRTPKRKIGQATWGDGADLSDWCVGG